MEAWGSCGRCTSCPLHDTSQLSPPHTPPPSTDYYSPDSIPVRSGNKQAYCMKPLEARRQRAAAFSADGDFTRTSKSMVRRTFFGYIPTFMEEEVRKDFAFQMFLLLCAEFVFITSIIYVITKNGTLEQFVKENPLTWYVVGSVGLVVYLVLAFFRRARISIQGIVLFTVFIVCFAYSLGCIAVIYDFKVLLYSFAIETSIIIFITILTKFAPCDVAGCAMIFCVLATGMCVFSVVASLIWLLTRFPLFQLVLAGVAIIVVSLYLMFNTQLMMETNLHGLQPSDYFAGNIHLYVDVLLMFVFIPIGIYKYFVRRKEKAKRKSERAARRQERRQERERIRQQNQRS